MDLAEKFERIVARAEELRNDLSSGLNGEAFSKASKELSELEPVVARIEEFRAAGPRRAAPRNCWPIPK